VAKPSKPQIPRQRVVGQEPTDLPPEALTQWRTVAVNEQSLRRYITAKAGSAHTDGVWAQALDNLYQHLKKNGPVDSVLAYFKTICRNEVSKRFKELAERAELYVGDDTYLLDDPQRNIHINPTARVELEEAFEVLRNALTLRQFKIFVLSEGFGLTAPQIVEALDEDIKPVTVRKDLMVTREMLRTPAVRNRLLGLGPIPE
jgi:DNA-directed RNA polymerase specialized sigma24 family protein